MPWLHAPASRDTRRQLTVRGCRGPAPLPEPLLWLRQRVSILKQLSDGAVKEEL